MKKTLISDPYRNPFHNRFHVPVHSRLDEMQAYTNLIWLDEKIISGYKADGTRFHGTLTISWNSFQAADNSTTSRPPRQPSTTAFSRCN